MKVYIIRFNRRIVFSPFVEHFVTTCHSKGIELLYLSDTQSYALKLDSCTIVYPH